MDLVRVRGCERGEATLRERAGAKRRQLTRPLYSVISNCLPFSLKRRTGGSGLALDVDDSLNVEEDFVMARGESLGAVTVEEVGLE
jgi:hypothetical protein